MGKLIGFAASFLLMPLIYSFGYEAYLFFASSISFSRIDVFLYGCLCYALIHVMLGDRLIFIQLFEHELGHTIMAFVFFKDVREFAVHEQGGEVGYQGGSNLLIRLAPYYLPAFTIPLLIIKPFVFPSIRQGVNFLIGLSLAFHYFFLYKEFRPSQPDIERTGLTLSFCVACILNTIFLVVILCIVMDSYSTILSYFENSLVRSFELCETALQEWQASNP